MDASDGKVVVYLDSVSAHTHSCVLFVEVQTDVVELPQGPPSRVYSYYRPHERAETVQVSKVKTKPLTRGTAAILLLCLSHEKVPTHFTPFKW